MSRLNTQIGSGSDATGRRAPVAGRSISSIGRMGPSIMILLPVPPAPAPDAADMRPRLLWPNHRDFRGLNAFLSAAWDSSQWDEAMQTVSNEIRAFGAGLVPVAGAVPTLAVAPRAHELFGGLRRDRLAFARRAAQPSLHLGFHARWRSRGPGLPDRRRHQAQRDVSGLLCAPQLRVFLRIQADDDRRRLGP